MKTIILTTSIALLFLVNYHLFTQDINHNNIKNIIEIKDKLELPFPFFDDFENGLGNWQVSGQDWDTVSVSYSSATHSVHSNPGGNYLPFSNASLTLLNAINLSASNLPVLTFWHKFQAADGVDLCHVEVSEDYGFNWSEITNFSGSNLTWSYVQIDLSAYKSVPIKLRFRLTSDGGYEYFGWNIDDIKINELNQNIDSFPFTDNFENGLSNWLVSSQDWDTVSVSYSSATHSVHSNPGGNYLPSSNASLTLLNAIDLSASNLPVLTFWHKFQAADGVDLCRVEVSEDYGFNWSEITSFSGSNLTWSYVQIDLSAYKSVPIKLRFRLTSDGGYEYFGWNIDDIKINELNQNIDSFPFTDNFENGLSNWLVSSQDWDTVSVSYSSATHSVHSNPGGNYLPSSNASLTLLNAIDLSASNLPVLTFWHKFQADDGVDLCRVEVSEDYGFNWSEITSFSGSNLTWSYVQIDLSAYKSVPVKLRFRLTSNGGYEYFGWNIDDVELSDFNTIDIDSLTIFIPQKTYLHQNYPNPFNPTTEISWQLAVGTPVRLAIYDLTGQEVAILVNEKREAGYHQVRFDGSDLASGIYLYRLQAGQNVETRKMILMK